MLFTSPRTTGSCAKSRNPQCVRSGSIPMIRCHVPAAQPEGSVPNRTYREGLQYGWTCAQLTLRIWISMMAMI
eukprot:6156180-Pleurochrysis_carterae.AAC.1